MRLSAKRTGLLNYSDYKKTKYRLLYALILFAVAMASAFALAPLLWLFFAGFKSAGELYTGQFSLLPREFNLSKVGQVWNILNFTLYFRNSLIVAAGAVVCSVLFNGMLAYALAVIKPWGHKFVFALLLGSYMIPTITGMVPLYKSLLDLGFVGNEYGLSLIPLSLTFGANVFYLIIYKNYFETLPKALFESANLDGATRMQSFFYILIPLSRPVIGVISIFTVTAAWSDFLMPYLLTRNTGFETIMVMIFNLSSTLGQGFTEDQLLMAITISIIPQVILFVLFQRQIMANVATSGIKE